MATINFKNNTHRKKVLTLAVKICAADVMDGITDSCLADDLDLSEEDFQEFENEISRFCKKLNDEVNSTGDIRGNILAAFKFYEQD